jgi:hypothetical protein
MRHTVAICTAANTDRFISVDTVELFDSLVNCANRANTVAAATVATAFLPAPLVGEITENYVLAVAIPSTEDIDWDALMVDQLVPHNEIDFEHRQATTLILFVDGPVAFEPFIAFQPLFATEGSLFVLFLHRGQACLVRYRWNERFDSTVAALYETTGENYRHDEERAARSIIVFNSPVCGAADHMALVPAAYFDIESDGSLSHYMASARARSEPERVAEECPELCSWIDA